MNAVVLLTAMTATTGLFGGHRQARHARPVAYAPTCQTSQCQSNYAPMAPVQAGNAPVQAPAMTYNSYYSPSAPVATCTTGSCPRR